MAVSSTSFKKGHKNGFSKGYTPWNKGNKMPESFIEKNRLRMLLNNHNKGRKFSVEYKRKLSEAQSGEKSHRWRGGVSFFPYTPEWTKILRLAIRQRDNFTCQKCGMTEKEHLKKFRMVLSVNHIDFDKNNCDPKNLNTLCRGCNTSINFNRKYWTDYFQSLILTN